MQIWYANRGEVVSKDGNFLGEGEQRGLGFNAPEVTKHQASYDRGFDYKAEFEALIRLEDESSRLWSMSSLKDGVELMLQSSIDLMKSDFGIVQLLDNSGLLRIFAQCGFKENFLETFREVSAEDDSACGRSLRTGEVVIIDDTEADEQFTPFRPIAREADFRSVVSIPLLTNERKPLGIISVHFRLPNQPNPRDVDRFRLYAKRAADFIGRCHLEQSQKIDSERWRLAVSLAGIGFCQWNVAQNSFSWSEECKKHLALPAGKEPSLDHFNTVVHPEDLFRVEQRISKAISERGAVEIDFRIVGPDGTVRWIDSLSRVVQSEAGELIMAGVTRDVTEATVIQRGLEEFQERLLHALDATEDGIWDLNIQTGECFFSPGYSKMLGYSELEFDSSLDSVLRLIHPDEKALVLDASTRGFENQGKYEMDLRMRHRNGHYVWVNSRGKVVERDSDGKPIRAIGTHVNVTERRNLLKKLETLNLELEERVKRRTEQAEVANLAKTRFLASMSHEIRNPLNTVSILSSLLAKSDLDAKARGEYLGKINRSVRAVTDIVDDILDYSKIEAGQVTLEKHEFSLLELLNNVVALFADQAKLKGLNFTVEPPETSPNVRGDLKRLQQVLVNLIGNAIKFTEKGSVWLKCHINSLPDHQVQMTFVVTDTGIGIRQEAIGKIFDPFTQAEEGTTRRFGGTGLGLAITHELVTLMDGNLNVESVEGLGTTFSFDLQLEVDDSADVHPDCIHGCECLPQLHGLHVLLVDDDRANVEVTRDLLLEFGAVVKTALDGSEACDLVMQSGEVFDVVLMDIQMPVMDGIQATRLIRKDPRFLALPIIAVTAGVLPDQQENAIESGITALLRKPVQTEEMLKILSSYTKQA